MEQTELGYMATVNAGSRPGSSKSNKVAPVTDQPNGISNGGFDPDSKTEKHSVTSEKF